MGKIGSAIFLAVLLLSTTAQPQTPRLFAEGVISTGQPEDVKESLRQALRDASVPGAAVAVVKNGKVVWSEGFGVSNLETRTPATPATKFGIGSISKSLTMVLAMRLREKGLLDLDAPIEKYLPDYPHAGRGVTIRHIGTHLSGYADEFDNVNFYNTKRYETTAEVLKDFYKEPLAAAPGERSIYGTTTFTLVAAAIEQVTGKTFASAMEEHILGPLKLGDIVLNDKRRVIPDRTAFYVRENGVTRNGQFVDPSFKYAGAGYLSTAEDLAKFGAALIEPGFLKKESLDQLFKLAVTKKGESTPFALGFRVVERSGRELIHQPGGGEGISSVLFIDRKNKVSIAILTNLTGAPAGSLDRLRAIADSFTGQDD